MARSSSGDSMIARVVRLLEAFGPESPSLTVSELADRARLPLSTTSRLVEQLVGQGLLSRDPRRRVRVGLRLWELAVRASPATGLRNAAMPFLEELHKAVGEHVQLAVLRSGEVLVIERLSSPRVLALVSSVGGRLPAHASASGLVLLAHATPSVQQAVLAAPRRQYTERTIVDETELRRQLAEIRRTGYVYADGHIDLRAAALAVPVRAGSAGVVASIAIVTIEGPCLQHLPLLRAMASGLSHTLGAPGNITRPSGTNPATLSGDGTPST